MGVIAFVIAPWMIVAANLIVPVLLLAWYVLTSVVTFKREQALWRELDAAWAEGQVMHHRLAGLRHEYDNSRLRG